MAMYRIKCEKCGYTTRPHYKISDCIKEKELAHKWGYLEPGYDEHDSAFGNMCPNCRAKTITEHRYFSDDEIRRIKSSIIVVS